MAEVLKAIKKAWLRFMAPKYFETYCFLYDKKLHDLDVPSTDRQVFCIVCFSQIENVMETISDDDVSETECMIYFKSSGTLVVGSPYKQVREMLIKYGYL